MIIVDMRWLQVVDLAPAIAIRARHLVTLARLVFAPTMAAHLVALTDPELPPLVPALAATMDEILSNAYIPTLGSKSLFVSLATIAADPLFVSHLLLRPELYKAAMLENFETLDRPPPPLLCRTPTGWNWRLIK